MSKHIEAFDAFTAPVFRLSYDNNKVEEACKEFIYRMEAEDQEACFYPHGYTSFSKIANIIVDRSDFVPLAEYCWGAVQTVHNQIGLTGTVNFVSSWLTIGRIHSYHERHHHNPHTWSGVYYAQAEAGDSDLVFYNPMMQSGWPHCDSAEFKPQNSLLTQCSVKTGDIIIFPSYLEHKVDQQTIDRDRITLAFNLNVVPDHD